MNNDSNRISANEINKFSYCPYQWYYERVYGSKELRRLKNELNKELGISDKRTENFSRGNKHHDAIYRRYKLKVLFIKIVILCVVLYLIYLGITGLINYGFNF